MRIMTAIGNTSQAARLTGEGLVVEGIFHLLNDVFRYGLGRCTSCCRKRLLESHDSMITE